MQGHPGAPEGALESSGWGYRASIHPGEGT